MQAHAAEKNAAAGIRKRSSVNALGASAKRRKLMSRRRRQICRPYTGRVLEMLACPGYLEDGSGFAMDGEMAFCSGHGVCNGTLSTDKGGVKDSPIEVGTCKCSAGFTGLDCSVPFGLRPAHEVAREIEELAKERAQAEIDAEKEESRIPGAEERPGLLPGQGPSVSTIRMRLELQFRAEGVNIAGQILPAVAKGVSRFSGLHSGVVLLTTGLHDGIKNDQAVLWNCTAAAIMRQLRLRW